MLNPNYTYELLGVPVKEKIIPDGTVWKDGSKAQACGFSKGSLFKKQKLLCGTGEPGTLTIHNTNDLEGTYEDSEQYVRATYNENMGEVRVHFYVDDVSAWQEMKAGTGMTPNDPEGSAEVCWHAGDGSTATGGNMTSLSMEIIMNDTAEHDAKAMDNGARVAAWLLWKHGLSIDKMVTHTYWVNKSAGKTFSDVDEQCCSPISGKKWCPTYIFASSNKTVAMKNWKKFKALVKSYMDQLDGSKEEPKAEEPEAPSTAADFKEGDVVSIAAGATYYGSSKKVPSWVLAKKWIVKEDPDGNRVVIDKSQDGKNAICSPIHAKYLTKVEVYVPKKGDIVNFTGTVHYRSANGTKPYRCTAGKAKITKDPYMVGKSKHPYHLQGINCSVHGWVDADSFTKA